MSTETNGSSGGRELAIATEPVSIRHLNGGVQALFRFPNGFGASVVNGPYTYGGTSGLWELAVVKWNSDRELDFLLTYDTDITADVIGSLTPGEIDELLTRVKNLDADGREPQQAASGAEDVSPSAELRQAADKLLAQPHCGGHFSDCACDYAEQMAATFRDIAKAIEEGRWVHDGVPAALDIARRINAAVVAS